MKIEITKVEFERIEITTNGGAEREFINSHVDVDFILNDVFRCNCYMPPKRKYKNEKKLIKDIIKKIKE